MSLSTPIVASLRLRRRSMASLVRVGDDQLWVELNTQPLVRAIIDVGFPAVVTQSRQVAGGGMLIAAERIDEHDGGGST
jgi:hypothetical protein